MSAQSWLHSQQVQQQHSHAHGLPEGVSNRRDGGRGVGRGRGGGALKGDMQTHSGGLTPHDAGRTELFSDPL